MNFYRFESFEQFVGAVGTTQSEFVKDGIQISVVGQIPDGGHTSALDEAGNLVYATPGDVKPDGTVYLEGDAVLEPTLKAGWHVNASAPVQGWDAMEVKPSAPTRVFG